MIASTIEFGSGTADVVSVQKPGSALTYAVGSWLELTNE